jgi:hypothetical protein
VVQATRPEIVNGNGWRMITYDEYLCYGTKGEKEISSRTGRED